METHSVDYYRDGDFTLRLNYLYDFILLHCIVTNWNKSTLRKIYSVFHTLKEESKSKGYRRLMTVTPNPKFAKLFGGETVGQTNYENKYYEVVEWVLK